MTELLDQAVEAARSLPATAQDEIARIVLQLTGAGDAEPPIALSPEEHAAIRVAQAEAARGDFATDEEVRAFRNKYSV